MAIGSPVKRLALPKPLGRPIVHFKINHFILNLEEKDETEGDEEKAQKEDNGPSVSHNSSG
jgi:hypothetical protein